MKLRNKLIPLLSVVASTTVVAPIVTSCGQSMEMVDITRNYIPTIEKAKEQPQGLTDIEAQDLYFEDVAKNPDVIKQDILKYEADRLPERIKAMEYPNSSSVQEWITTSVTAQVGVNNVSARKVTANIEGEEVFFYALSANIKYVTQFKFLSMDGTKEEIYDQTFSMTLKDIPTEVYTQTVIKDYKNTNRWYISNVFVDDTEDGAQPSKKLNAVPGWCYSFEESHTNTYNTRTKTGEVISNSTSSNDYGSFSRLDQITNLIEAMKKGGGFSSKYLSFESFHLSDIGFKKAAGTIKLNVDSEGTINANYSIPTSDPTRRNGLTIDNFNLIKLDSSTAKDIVKSTNAEIYVGCNGEWEEWEDEEDFTTRSSHGQMIQRNYFENYHEFWNSFDIPTGFAVADDAVGTTISELKMCSFASIYGKTADYSQFSITEDNTISIGDIPLDPMRSAYFKPYALYTTDDDSNKEIGSGDKWITYDESTPPTLSFKLWDDNTTHHIGYAYIGKDDNKLHQDYVLIEDPVYVNLTYKA